MTPSICLYFQLHQPHRLRQFDFFSIGGHQGYGNPGLDEEVLHKVSAKCYRPACDLLLRAGRRHGERFRFGLSASGLVLEQLQGSEPGVLKAFQELVASGSAEVLGETYHHSLASLFSKAEFRRQVKLQEKMLEKTFGVLPRVFRNTELLYSDEIAETVSSLGYQGMLAEGVTWRLEGKTPNQGWLSAGPSRLPLLLRNRRLSDDLAFRFGDPAWKEYPLAADRFLGWIVQQEGAVVNLFMDLESMGEHLWEDTGVFRFWEELIDLAVAEEIPFVTPGEAIAENSAAESYPCPTVTSWADCECDESAWLGNGMQKEAANGIYALEREIRRSGDPEILDLWGWLQTSDHFHYMSTKGGTDGAVHGYFNPYENPYDYYLYYMNVLADLQILLGEKNPVPTGTRPGRIRS